ncbi:MAG: CaiB/BaiF CoA transferase family protein [Salinirussus sp.]
MLDDIQVLDLSHLLPGQYATALLSQLGAEVVSVEPPEGDYLRQYPASFAAFNHSKRSLTLDLKDEAGLEAFLSLAETADVIVEEFRPGVAERLGVNYEAVSTRNPSIVYCSVSGHGQESPRADHVGHDLNYIGLAGVLDLSPQQDGLPQLPPVLVADVTTGIFAALCVAAAVHDSDGEYIDLSMTDAALNAMAVHLAEYTGRGGQLQRGNSAMLGAYPANAVYTCADGRLLTVAAIEPKFWNALCEALSLEQFEDDQWPQDDDVRERMFEAFRTRFQQRPREEWLELFDQSTVPVEPVQSLSEVFEDEAFASRGALQSVDLGGTEFPVTTVPARFRTHDVALTDPPQLGEHSKTILEAAGLSTAEIDALLNSTTR